MCMCVCVCVWLERVHGKHKIVSLNPTRSNFLHEIEKSYLKMNTIYLVKFHHTPMINSKKKFEIIVWRLMKGLSTNEL